MVYKNFSGKKLSALGLGTMRLPLKSNNSADIDENIVNEMVDYAIENGVNYFDTAWGYHNGNSELAVGRALKRHPRGRFYLADKFPGYDRANISKVEEIFEKQLEKCQVEYFDFYMFHNLCEYNVNEYLDPQFRIFEYLSEQKKKGRIKHLGVSTHGTLHTNRRFLDVYGKEMEFCQIQLNWLDWSFQNADQKVQMLKEYGIPVWVMEPLRGGKLANVKFDGVMEGQDPVKTAFRFLQGIDNVTVTLSGMSDMKQLKENIVTFNEEKLLSDSENQYLLDLAQKMTSKTSVPCTSCRYCTDKCPQQLDIPYLIELYNEHSFTGGGFIAPMALSPLKDKKPSACIACRSCESVCPQNIKISEVMSEFVKKLKIR